MNKIISKLLFRGKPMHHLIETRLTLIRELEEKLLANIPPTILDLGELSVLFEKNLWIFSPQYDSIEYITNQGSKKIKNSINTVISSYSCKETRRTLIISFYPGEINLDKRRDIEDHIDELVNIGAIPSKYIIEAYILGNTVTCNGIIIGKGEITIIPITYQQLLENASKRLLNLQIYEENIIL